MVEEPTAAQEEQDEIVEWEISRVKFIQRIVETVTGLNFLSFYLATAFKFYINKVLLYFLTRETLQAYHTYDDRNPKLQEQLTDLLLKVTVQLSIQFRLLTKNSHLRQPIDKFEDGFNTEIQDFTAFKVAYRNTVGRVYEEAHKKLSQNLHKRTTIKLKLFLCHIINRAFTGSLNSSIFPYYSAWTKRQNIKVSDRYYDFNFMEAGKA